MKQPKVFSREQLINAAIDLIREKGHQALTARALAKQIGSSTMPIYSTMKSIPELEKELRPRVRSLLRSHQQKPYTDQALLNLAFGYITFARDEPRLFQFLYQHGQHGTAGQPEPDISDFRSRFLEEFGADSSEARALAAMDPDAQENLIHHTWIFTHGLAMLLNSGSYHAGDEEILRRLRIAGEAFYLQDLRSRE
jgi:AcrR family transcriptional regulator